MQYTQIFDRNSRFHAILSAFVVLIAVLCLSFAAAPAFAQDAKKQADPARDLSAEVQAISWNDDAKSTFDHWQRITPEWALATNSTYYESTIVRSWSVWAFTGKTARSLGISAGRASIHHIRMDGYDLGGFVIWYEGVTYLFVPDTLAGNFLGFGQPTYIHEGHIPLG